MNPAETIPQERAAGPSPLEWTLLHAGFVLTGIVTTILGPILPMLSSRWLLSDALAGSLFTAQFLGSLLGVLSTSVLLPRRGFRTVLAAGFLLMAAGVSGLGLSGWPFGWLAIFGFGVGLGLTIPSTNLYVSQAASGRRAAALSILNLSWGLGAVACPLLIALFGRRVGLPGLLISLGTVLAAFALAFSSQTLSVNPQRPSPRERSPAFWAHFEPRPRAWALAALFFLYVGTENALGGWVATHARRVSGPPEALWVVTPSAFWGALLLGRALAPVALRFLIEAKLAAVGLLLASCGTLAVLLSTTPSGIRVGAGIAGLGLAPVFPILVAWLAQQFESEAPRAGGVMFALAGCGGATLPWLVGAVSTRFGSLQVGLGIPLLSCLVMLVTLRAASSAGGAKAASAGAALR